MAEDADFRKWIPGADSLVTQAWYRVLGVVSIHAPINEVFQAIQEGLLPKRGGQLYWVREGRLARWEDLEVWPGVRMSIWILGQRVANNTAYLRIGWWRLYLTDAALNAFRPKPREISITKSREFFT